MRPDDIQIQLSPTLRTTFALTFLLIIGIAILAYRNAWRVYHQGEWVAHTQEVRVAVNGVLSAMEDAETGERGFVITGDDTFLDPYLVAQHEIPQRVRELRNLVSDNADQVRRVADLQPRIEAKLAELRESIDVRRHEGFERAAAVVREGRGKRDMDAIRIIVAAMRDSEDSLLATQEHAINQAIGSATASVTIAAVIVVAFLSLLYVILRRHLHQRERLLLETRQARGDAEAASRAKDSFLATVSHELRTPLSPILAWTEMLERGVLDAAQTQKALDTIRRCARAQAQLIEDLLDVSRIIAGKLRLQVRPVDLRAVIEAAMDVVRPAADAKHIRLQVVLDTETAPISGDPDRLQQVVWNLIANAVKFTTKGGRVNVVLERVNSHVEVAVSDTGQGIAPAFLPHVFDRFWQADAHTTRTQGGLGLGLAIVRSIVEAHGGTVHVESPGLGKGSVFTVKLPLVMIQRAAGEAIRRHPTEVPLTAQDFPALGELRALVVDDEPDSNEAVRTLLANCGAEVRVAGSASQALDILDRWKPDVLITDIGMPGEDGYALLAKVRARNDETARLPVIALTAYASADDRVRLLSAGFAMHVAKPVEAVELLAVVAGVAQRA